MVGLGLGWAGCLGWVGLGWVGWLLGLGWLAAWAGLAGCLGLGWLGAWAGLAGCLGWVGWLLGLGWLAAWVAAVVVGLQKNGSSVELQENEDVADEN